MEKSTRPKKQVGQCKICNAPAIYSYFGVLSCRSCKTFFKRHGEMRTKTPICRYENQCEINLNNRHICSACRLKKCFECGMDVAKFRPPSVNLTRVQQPRQTQDNQRAILLPTINLLRSDSSTLTRDQWTLCNNLFNNYDIKKIFAQAESLAEKDDFRQVLLTDQNRVLEYLSSFYQEAGTAFRTNGDFRLLSSSDRSILLHTATHNLTCLAGIYTFAHTSLYRRKAFTDYLDTIYNPLTMKYHRWVTQFPQCDSVVFKLALALFSVSTLSRICEPNLKDEYIDVKPILEIENRYAELIWKYLSYRYTFKEAVRQYFQIIRWFSAMGVFMSVASSVQAHVTDMNNVIEDTELKLILDDFDV